MHGMAAPMNAGMGMGSGVTQPVMNQGHHPNMGKGPIQNLQFFNCSQTFMNFPDFETCFLKFCSNLFLFVSFVAIL